MLESCPVHSVSLISPMFWTCRGVREAWACGSPPGCGALERPHVPERVTSARHRAWHLQRTAMEPFYSFPAGGSPLASEVQIT